MRRSRVTWRLSFASMPDPALLERARTLLEPIAEVRTPPDYGAIQREYGFSDHLFIEPERELCASDLAFHVLEKCRRLGSGWSVMWPGFERVEGGGYLAEAVRRAALPEALDRLTGSFDATLHEAEAVLPGLVVASFEVTVLPAVPVPVPPPHALPAAPSIPSVADLPSELTRPLMGALLGLLVRFRTFPWQWQGDALLTQLEQLGFWRTEEESAAVRLQASDGTMARVVLGQGPPAVEFFLAREAALHLLEEEVARRRREELEALFQVALLSARPLLGQPAFLGASGDDGFPVDWWADWLALWPCGDRRIAIIERQEDTDLPIEVCLVFAPPG